MHLHTLRVFLKNNVPPEKLDTVSESEIGWFWHIAWLAGVRSDDVHHDNNPATRSLARRAGYVLRMSLLCLCISLLCLRCYPSKRFSCIAEDDTDVVAVTPPVDYSRSATVGPGRKLPNVTEMCLLRKPMMVKFSKPRAVCPQLVSDIVASVSLFA